MQYPDLPLNLLGADPSMQYNCMQFSLEFPQPLFFWEGGLFPLGLSFPFSKFTWHNLCMWHSVTHKDRENPKGE